jgi:hypothetical protein
MLRPPPVQSVRRGRITRRDVVMGCAFTAVTVAISAALLAAATLVPAPAAVVPLVAVVCIGCPMFAVWDLSHRTVPRPAADSVAEADRALDAKALKDLRRALARLPETRHPLGL